MGFAIVIGIDPGAKGAAAILDLSGQVHGLVDYDPAPGALVGAMVEAIPPCKPSLVVLEQANAFPGQGVTSMFRFGTNYGIWQGIAGAMGWPLEIVRPVKWRSVLDSATPKKPSKHDLIAAAYRRFPDAEIGKKDGRAEALLIAEYARRQMVGGRG